MEKKAYLGGEELDETRIYTGDGPLDNKNPWIDEIWDTYYGDTLIYHKDKTWRNTWLKYGYVAEDSPGNSTAVPQGTIANMITDLQDFFEHGGCVQQLYKAMSNTDKAKLREEFFRVAPLVDFRKSLEYFSYRWRGLAGNSWEKQGGVRFTSEEIKNPVVLKFRNKDDGSGHKLSTTSFFAGTNIDKVELRFDTKSVITNAHKMFYRMCPYPTEVKVLDLDGNPIVSSKERGFSPSVLSEIWADNTTDWGTPRIKPIPTNNIYYGNVHSAQMMVWGNNIIEHIPPFNNAQIGEEIEGNIMTLHYPANGKDYISSPRDRGYEFSHSYSLKTIGPLLNLRYARNQNMFQDSANITEMRLKHLNNDNWSFAHMANLSRESVVYMLTHLWDRVSKWMPYEHLQGEERVNTLNETLVQHQNRLRIDFHENHRAYLTNDLIQSADRKGWDIYINNQKVTSV